MSIRDIIMVVRKQSNTGAHAQDAKDAQRKGRKDACDVWQDIPDNFKTEVRECIHYFKFPGQGQQIQEVINLKGALKLIEWIPGKMAKAVRSRAVDILVQYFDNNTEKFISWTVESAKQVQEEEAEREPDIKYVYGAESEAFPGLVKIGFTSSLDARMDTANTFCAPAPFRIVAHVPSMDARRDERMAHAFFSDRREEGEFFRVSVEEVTTFFTTCVLPLYNQESNP
jgi:hypothetical protein